MQTRRCLGNLRLKFSAEGRGGAFISDDVGHTTRVIPGRRVFRLAWNIQSDQLGLLGFTAGNGVRIFGVLAPATAKGGWDEGEGSLAVPEEGVGAEDESSPGCPADGCSSTGTAGVDSSSSL